MEAGKQEEGGIAMMKELTLKKDYRRFQSKTYTRKTFKAEIFAIAVNGVGYPEEYEEFTRDMNSSFFKDYSSLPSQIYAVEDQTRKPFRINGFIFETEKGWGFIERIDVNTWMCWYRNLVDAPFREKWHKQKGEAVAKLFQNQEPWLKQESKTKPRFYAPEIDRDRQILGLQSSFTLEELKRAYRQLCLKHHPDTGDGDRQALEKIYSAYERLRKESHA